MLVKVLASGSTGNSCFVKTDKYKFLIDVGITKKKIEEALNKIGESVKNLDYIFITHEHVDHIKGLLVTLKYTKTIVFLSSGTLSALLEIKDFKEFYYTNNNRFIELKKNGTNYEDIYLDNLIISPLEAFHDAREPVGYLFNNSNKKLAFLTDTGYVHNNVMNKIKDCDCYIFETNHDPEILMNSERPYILKKRILSDYGHLSNADSLYALANLVGNNTKYIICAHISLECNLRDIIRMTYERIFLKLGIDNKNIKLIMSLPTDIEEISI